MQLVVSGNNLFANSCTPQNKKDYVTPRHLLSSTASPCRRIVMYIQVQHGREHSGCTCGGAPAVCALMKMQVKCAESLSVIKSR